MYAQPITDGNKISGSVVSKEIIDFNENSVSHVSNCSSQSSNEAEDVSSSTNLQLNFHHYVNSISDYGSDIDDNLNEISCSKIQKSDIESDVNIWSDEDDEVLELSVKYKRNETVNISSTESEEECDYGPTFKKVEPSYRILSPLIFSYNL